MPVSGPDAFSGVRTGETTEEFYMEKLFRQSRRAMVIAPLSGVVLGLAAGAYLYYVKGMPQVRALLAVPVILAVSLLIGKYVSRLVATREYQLLMSLLYADLQPEKFIEAVEPLANAKTDPVTKTTTMAHLANGYAAAGRFEEAHRILEHTELPDEAVALRGLLLNNLISCLLLEGKQQKARSTQTALRNLLLDERCSRDFKEKVQRSLAYQDICLNIYKARPADIAALECDFDSSRNELHKLEVKLYLAIAYRQKGDQERFHEAQDYVIQKSGDALYYGKAARALSAEATP